MKPFYFGKHVIFAKDEDDAKRKFLLTITSEKKEEQVDDHGVPI